MKTKIKQLNKTEMNKLQGGACKVLQYTIKYGDARGDIPFQALKTG